jgi:predicted dehydrogenase
MSDRRLRVGMAGLGMIFRETYEPLFRQLLDRPILVRDVGSPVRIELTSLLSRTGSRVRQLSETWPSARRPSNHFGDDALDGFLANDLDVVCVATPDHRHFEIARAAVDSGRHVLIEKPSVLRLDQLDDLVRTASEKQVLVKVVYHKLFDPDHKRLRTLYRDQVLRHVNNGYCSLLEPKSISQDQFAEWIVGRNPASYVGVHYFKLIDFTFASDWRLVRIEASGQRGLVGPSSGTTWDAVQTRLTYRYDDGREAAFDVHTDWVTPEEFPGAVEQEVQFRFDNGVWNAHQRKRGVEVTIEGPLPDRPKTTPNHHYSAEFLEPWGERRRRGYGLEAIERFFEEVAYVEFGGPPPDRESRIEAVRGLAYNDLAADRNVVAAVQGVEAILARRAAGLSGAVVEVTDSGLALRSVGDSGVQMLYRGRV